MQSNSFYPTLNVQDILDVMNQMEISISEEDLEKPTPQRGVSLDAVDETSLDLSEITDYPESHSEDILLISFYQRMMVLLRQVGVEDFSLRDMLKPEPVRVKRILSSVCNFAMFRDDRMPVLEKYTAKADEEYERLQKMQAELAQVQAEIAKIRAQHERDVPQVNKLEEETKAMERDIKKHASTQKAATETNNKLRSEKSELQDAVGAISHTIAGLQEELKKLNARVVHSPEKIKEAIAQLTQSIASGRTQLAQKESESRQLAAKIEMLDEILTDIRGCIQQMADAEDIVRRHEEELRKLAAEKESVSQETSNLKNLSVREEQFKYQDESAKGKIERLSQTRQAKQNKEMTARFTEISCKMAEQRARYDETPAAIQESYEKLRQQTLEYQDSVILSLEELLSHFYD
ncbi:hypothetical protein DL89DRAFT_264853 [Linderina pennispora]|uniref:Uncharacterized protein n=1 Tax=Linderina pennispora TaxID=61395 RepID=A0A1Y1WGM0_9FUNG|nr:uncharacterized protein DL89DRAFT_264853 [Linderina pennispora]ORX72637.1 hypothetical protein DL89DRAFT_264853 [Linderina pennispora]